MRAVCAGIAFIATLASGCDKLCTGRQSHWGYVTNAANRDLNLSVCIEKRKPPLSLTIAANQAGKMTFESFPTGYADHGVGKCRNEAKQFDYNVMVLLTETSFSEVTFCHDMKDETKLIIVLPQDNCPEGTEAQTKPHALDDEGNCAE